MYTIHTMASYSSQEILAILREDGWALVATDGSHHQFKHPTKPGRVTVKHPQKDVPIGTLKSVFKQAGWDWNSRKR